MDWFHDKNGYLLAEPDSTIKFSFSIDIRSFPAIP